MVSAALDFFGLSENVERAQALADSTADERTRAEASIAVAWYLRQRDTRAALRYADAGAALLDRLPPEARAPACGRLALTRGEAAFLFNRIADANAELAQARIAFASAGDAIGLGDAELLDAWLLDQTGGDRSSAIRAAARHYSAAGDPLRERAAATWSACAEATAHPDDAEANWGAALREASAQHHPGLDTYVEGAAGTLAWRRGDLGAAIASYQRGFEAALASGQLHSAITLAHNIAIGFSKLNDQEEALVWTERARALVRPTAWPYLSGWSVMQAGSILIGLGRAAEARELLLEGMPSLAGSEGSRNHAMACQLLGEACVALHADEEALRWCEASYRAALKLDHPDLVSGALRYLALSLSRLGRVDEALRAAAEGVEIARAQHDWQYVATIEHVRAQIAREHALPAPAGSAAATGAMHHLQAALAAGAQMPGYVATPEWLAELAGEHERAGDLAKALDCERQAARARAQVQSRRVEQMTTALLLRHETERARAEARHERTQAESSELRAKLLETQAALEQERMQSLLVHAAKLVAIGRLASGVVHEMSHPVGTLLLLAEALSERLAGSVPADVGASLQTLLAETRRLQQFIVRLRDFARAEPPRLARHDLNHVLADARQLFAPRLRVERVRYDEAVPSLPVHVDPQRLALTLANLVFNAADAVRGKPDAQVFIEALRVGDAVELHVDDNGPGLSDAVLARLFEPFFTTKPEGQGLGLGLALSAEALAAMGGSIRAANRAQGGARFTIVLPAV